MEEFIVFESDSPEPAGVPDGDTNAVPDPGEFDGTIHYTDTIPERYRTSIAHHRIDCRLHYTYPDPERYCTCKRNAKRDRGVVPDIHRNIRAYREYADTDSDNWDFEPYA